MIPAGNIVSVNTADHGGGAERIAWTLFKAFQQNGLGSWLVVGDKKSDDPGVIPFFQSPHIDYQRYGSWPRQTLQRWRKWLDRRSGRDDFNFPYSKYLPSITGSPADVIHFHNLHGGYFDLRVLAKLSRRHPVFWTLHDSWPFTGHCACPNGCGRWQTGCGACPDLSLPPAVERDATRSNWRRKRAIFLQSKFYLATPSQWLMDRAEQSVLSPAIMERRVIPNGVDLTVFKPGCQQLARQELNIPQNVRLVVFAANNPKTNPYKDCATIRNAVKRAAKRMPDVELRCLIIGEQSANDSNGNGLIQYVPFQTREKLAQYFQAADIYLHAAKEDVLPTVVMEAMGCAAPVVATAVGGIPELVTHQENGLLVPKGDADSMASAIELLLTNDSARQAMGRRAAETAKRCFDHKNMVASYLEWYGEVLEKRNSEH